MIDNIIITTTIYKGGKWLYQKILKHIHFILKK